jgi:hypothetical protein
MIGPLSQQQAAWLLGVTPRALRDMDAPRAENGTYCARTLVEWRYRDKGFTSQRERLAARQAEKFEIEIAIKYGELLYAREVEAVWATHIANARDRLRALPRKLAPQLATCRSVDLAAAMLLKEIDDALNELGDDH